MNALKILDVLVPRVEVLRPNPGDVVAISLTRKLPDEVMADLAKDVRRLILEHGKSVVVCVLPPGMTNRDARRGCDASPGMGAVLARGIGCAAKASHTHA